MGGDESVVGTWVYHRLLWWVPTVQCRRRRWSIRNNHWRRMRRLLRLLLVVVVVVGHSRCFSMAATTTTTTLSSTSGYDSLGGTEALCWKSRPTTNTTSTSVLETTRLEKCPGRTGLELLVERSALYTQQQYTYHVKVKIDPSSFSLVPAKELVAFDNSHHHNNNNNNHTPPNDDVSTLMALRLVFCPIGVFCTPFLLPDTSQSMVPFLPSSVLDTNNESSSRQQDTRVIALEGTAFVAAGTEQETDHYHSNHHHDQYYDTVMKGPHRHHRRRRRRYLQSLSWDNDDDNDDDKDDPSSRNQEQVYVSHYLLIDNTTAHDFLGYQHHDNNHNHTTTTTTTSFMYEFHVDFQLAVGIRGQYVPMVTLQYFVPETNHDATASSSSSLFNLTNTTDNATTTIVRYDVANLLSDRSLLFTSPTQILTIDSAMAILSYVIIGITGSIQWALLLASLYYRKEGVMRLSQGNFLIALQACGLIASVSAFLYAGNTSTWCFLQSPLTLIPLQVMLAIIFGRLRRIISIMAPLIEWDHRTEEGLTERSAESSSYNRTASRRRSSKRGRQLKQGLKNWKSLMFDRRRLASSSNNSDSHSPTPSGNDDSGTLSLNGSTSQRPGLQRPSEQDGSNWQRAMARSRRKIQVLRQTFTAARLGLLVTIVTLPTFILVVVGLIVFPPFRTLTLNDDGSIGRWECGDGQDQIYQMCSTAVVFLTLFLDLYEANRSRGLPAFFTEAEQISGSLLVSLFVAILGLAVIIITENPVTDPSIPYIFKVIVVCVVSLNTSARLIWPKLRLIWKGEKVVISKILSDHRRSQAGMNDSIRQFHQQYPQYAQKSDEELDATRVAGAVSASAPSMEQSASFDLVVEDANTEDDLDTPKSHDSFAAASLGKSHSTLGAVPEDDSLREYEEEEMIDEAKYPMSSTPDGSAHGRRISFATDDDDMKRASSRSLNYRPTTRSPLPQRSLDPMHSCPVLVPPEDNEPPRSFPPSRQHQHQYNSRTFVLVEGKTPPSKLMLGILNHSKLVSRLNERVLSGFQVTPKDWESLKASVQDVEGLLERIEYA